MLCRICNGPVEVKGLGDLPAIFGKPIVIDKPYLQALVCSGCQKKCKECTCPEYNWNKK